MENLKTSQQIEFNRQIDRHSERIIAEIEPLLRGLVSNFLRLKDRKGIEWTGTVTVTVSVPQERQQERIEAISPHLRVNS